MFLMYGGGIAGLYALLSLFSVVSGVKLEFGASGTNGGVPLPSSWPAISMLVAAGPLLYWLGTRWDAPRFVAVRARHRWLVPVVVTFIVFPAFVAALFAMLQ